MKRIQVLHIQAGALNSGAGRGAFWLHKALMEKGIDSRILVQFNDRTEKDGVIRSFSDNRQKDWMREMTRRDAEHVSGYPQRDPFLFSPGMHGIRLNKYEAYRSADLIHLHWINWGFISIPELSRIRKPIVWTFRDPWPFTGGCHLPYIHNCKRYTINCGCCPHLKSRDMFDLSWKVMRLKKRYYGSNIHPVAMSPWMMKRIEESALFRHRKAEMIPNNIDTALFTPFDKKKARQILQLPQDRKIILFGAGNLGDRHKGLEIFLKSLERYRGDSGVLSLFFGRDPRNLVQQCPTDKVSMGFVNDDQRLRMIFAAADVFAAPLKQDNFSKTIGEAMSCGLPVINRRNEEGNPVLVHQKNCFLAENDSAEAFSEGYEWIFSMNEMASREISLNARQSVVSHCSFDEVSRKYMALYSRLLD